MSVQHFCRLTEDNAHIENACVCFFVVFFCVPSTKLVCIIRHIIVYIICINTGYILCGRSEYN